MKNWGFTSWGEPAPGFEALLNSTAGGGLTRRFCWRGLSLTGSVLVLQPTFLVELSKVLANPGNTQVARVAAGLQVKNSLTSKDPDIKTQYQQRWLAIDANARREIKNYVSAPR